MKLVARVGDQNLAVQVERHGAGYRVRIGERVIDANLITANPYLRSLQLSDHSQFVIAHHAEGNRHEISFSDALVSLEMFDPLAMRRRRREEEEDGPGAHVCAFMPGRVVRVLVEEGATVKKGQGLLILEAMKMENEISAPRDALVTKIVVSPGQPVENGDELLLLE